MVEAVQSVGDDGGWMPGTRAKRRLGPVEVPAGGAGGSSTQFFGIAGLQRTVVERLLAEDEPEDAAPAACLATVQHVMGGGCAAGGAPYDAALRTMQEGVGWMQYKVDWAGGATSELAQLLARARACLDGSRAQRAQRTPAEWDSVRRVLAAHLPAPDWLSPHDEGDRGMRRLLDEQLVATPRAWQRRRARCV